MTKRSTPPRETRRCPVCREERRAGQLFSGTSIRPAIRALVEREHPDWSAEQLICEVDIHHYRLLHVQNVVMAERDEVSELDRDVLDRMRAQDLIANDVDRQLNSESTLGERMSDRIASFGGSWTFILIFSGIIVVWIFVNALVLTTRPFDPYPFILLNLVLSCLAAMQAPIIMMSQNRQDAKDRVRAEHDYRVNLKAELEIQMLHEKMDHLLLHRWEALLDVQETQAELLDELTRRLER